MPFKEIESILKIFFHKTKHHKTNKGFFKHVFIIHSNKRKLALKIGRSKKHINKDYRTYNKLPQNIRNRYFAKIYWVDNLFMLQKYGKHVNVPKQTLDKLKNIGKTYGLKDIRPANILKIDGRFKIIDAESSH